MVFYLKVGKIYLHLSNGGKSAEGKKLPIYMNTGATKNSLKYSGALFRNSSILFLPE